MTTEDLMAKALQLSPEARAEIAVRLLESLENLSAEESESVWLREAARRDAELDADPNKARPAKDVFRDARSKLK